MSQLVWKRGCIYTHKYQPIERKCITQLITHKHTHTLFCTAMMFKMIGRHRTRFWNSLFSAVASVELMNVVVRQPANTESLSLYTTLQSITVAAFQTHSKLPNCRALQHPAAFLAKYSSGSFHKCLGIFFFKKSSRKVQSHCTRVHIAVWRHCWDLFPTAWDSGMCLFFCFFVCVFLFI